MEVDNGSECVYGNAGELQFPGCRITAHGNGEAKRESERQNFESERA